MLNGNKLVIILPLILMGFIFFGGYNYLQETSSVTNELLYEKVEIEAVLEQTGENLTLSGNWLWGEMPAEGLMGDDYLGVSFLDEETGVAISIAEIEASTLQLLHGEKVVYETEGTKVGNGVVYTYPNQIVEHESYGNKGSFTVAVKLEEEKKVRASVVMLHTWEEHEGLIIEEPRMVEPQFPTITDNSYWVMEWTFE